MLFRSALIVQQHGSLKYPEGTACAEVLKAGANAESRAAADPFYAKELANASINARTIFAGFGIALLALHWLFESRTDKVKRREIGFGAMLKRGELGTA